MYSIQTAEVIVKLLSRPGSPIILVFWPRAPVPNSKGTLSAGALNTRGVGKFCDFRLKSPFIIEKWDEIGVSLHFGKVDMERQVADRSVSVPMTLNDDLEKRKFLFSSYLEHESSTNEQQYFLFHLLSAPSKPFSSLSAFSAFGVLLQKHAI